MLLIACDSDFAYFYLGFPDLVKSTSSNHVSEMVAFDKNGMKIVFTLKPFPETPNTTTINIEARNNTSVPISEFLFQVAVPKVRVSQFTKILFPFY